MAAPDRVRVTRTKNRIYPYTWRCTVPDERSYTGECGATSFARSEYLAKLEHASHMTDSHTEPEENDG